MAAQGEGVAVLPGVLSRAAISSAVSPMPRVILRASGPAPSATAASAAANVGLTNRQPRLVSAISPGGDHGWAGLARTHGARVIDSTPPATTTSASPALMELAADATAVRPLAHKRLMV